MYRPARSLSNCVLNDENAAARSGRTVSTRLYKIYKSAAGLVDRDKGEIIGENSTDILRNLHSTGVSNTEIALKVQENTRPLFHLIMECSFSHRLTFISSGFSTA